jgi:hypothetical protein
VKRSALRKARSVPSFDAPRNCLSCQKSNEGGLSRDKTSLQAKIDVFFPIHGNGDYGCSAAFIFPTLSAILILNACIKLKIGFSPPPIRSALI